MSKNYLRGTILFAIACLVMCIACTSTKKTDPLTVLPLEGGQEDQTTIFMYDNCPNETSAQLAELALKSAMPGYEGTSVFSYSGKTPALSDLQAVKDYYGYCQKIRTAISRGSNRLCFLSFNTGKFGSDISLDLSSDEAIFESLVKMAAYNKTSIYAIYSY